MPIGINPTLLGRLPVFSNTAYGVTVHVAPTKNLYASYGLFDGNGAMVYLVTGGGGAHLEEKKFGYFHHAMVLRVTKNSVSEKIFVVTRDEDIEDRIERFALATVYPWLTVNLLVTAVVNSIVLAFSIILLKQIYQHRKGWKINFTSGRKGLFS